MKINFAVSRRIRKTEKGKKIIESKRDSIDMPGCCMETDHAIIISAINQKYPGWAIIGYAEARE